MDVTATNLPDVLDQVECARKAALCGGPLLLACTHAHRQTRRESNRHRQGR